MRGPCRPRVHKAWNYKLFRINIPQPVKRPPVGFSRAAGTFFPPGKFGLLCCPDDRRWRGHIVIKGFCRHRRTAPGGYRHNSDDTPNIYLGKAQDITNRDRRFGLGNFLIIQADFSGTADFR